VGWGQEEEKAIRELYAGLQAELEARDTTLLSMYYAAEFQNVQREDLNLFQQNLEKTLLGYEELTVTLEVAEIKVVEEQARARVVRTLKGIDAETRKPKEETGVFMDELTRQADGWRIFYSGEIDLTAQQQLIQGQQINDPANGLALTVPEQWQLCVYKTPFPRFVGAMSPRLTGEVILGLADLPTPATAEQALKIDEKVAAAVQADRQTLREGTIQVAGQPAYESVTTFTMGNEKVQTRRIYVVYEGTVYFLVCQASQEDFAENEPGFQEVVDGLRLSPRQRPTESVAGGRVEGRTYRNETYGLEITAPEGWTVQMNQSQFLVQVSMNSPEGDGLGLLIAVDLPVEVSAKEACLGDEKMAQNVASHYEVVSQGEVEVNGRKGYECVSVFDMENLPKRQRIRNYFVVGKRLYVLAADVIPPEKFGDLEVALRAMLGSFKLAEAE
jgi:hypothetical protein